MDVRHLRLVQSARSPSAQGQLKQRALDEELDASLYWLLDEPRELPVSSLIGGIGAPCRRWRAHIRQPSRSKCRARPPRRRSSARRC